MNVRRLVGGVLLPGFIGRTPPSWLLSAIDDGLAGVVYFAPNIDTAAQVAGLSARLRGAREDLLVSADEEGGDVTRLRSATGSHLPGNAALGAVDDEAVTEAVAAAIGRELRLVGVDLNLAPCVDVNCDPANPVIGVRSFGSSPELVARHGAAYVRGLQAAGVAACAKHYPGHGDTRVDSHLMLPSVPATAETVRARELPPFAAAVAAGARCVLTAHVLFPAFDRELPATLSPTLLGMLRTELGFDGVIITDALDMHAISRTVGLGAGAVASLVAGADLLCLGNPDNEPDRGDGEDELRLVWDAVEAAVASGELPLARLEQAHERVRSLAEWTTAARATPLPPAATPDFGRQVASRAIEVTGVVRLASRPELVDLRRHVNQAAGRNAAALTDELSRRAPSAASTADGGMVVLVDEPQRDAEVRAQLSALLASRPDAVVVATGWPDPSIDLGHNVVRTFGNARANAEAAADVLFGASLEDS
jgi:beta-N-acetylhexosaminidase